MNANWKHRDNGCRMLLSLIHDELKLLLRHVAMKFEVGRMILIIRNLTKNSAFLPKIWMYL